MSKYTIRKPQIMEEAGSARHKPRVVIAILISLAIFVAHTIVAVVIGLVYVGSVALQTPGFLQSSLTQMTSLLNDIVMSQTFLLIMFYSMALTIVFVIIQVKAIDKRKLYTIGMTRKRVVRSYLMGIGIGAGLILSMLVPTLISEYGSISFNGFTPLLAIVLVAVIIQSAAEEILFRGYLMSALGNRVSTLWAVIISSLVFGLLHLVNGGATVLLIAQAVLVGALLGFYVVRTNNIWGACGMHFAWNFVQGLYSEIKFTGVTIDYSVIKFENVDFNPEPTNLVGNPADLIVVGFLIAAIALVLFAGKKRIVIKKQAAISEDLAL